MRSTEAKGQTVKKMEFTYNVGVDDNLDLPVPFFQPYPTCNPTVYPETKLLTKFVGDFKGRFRDPFPHLTLVKGVAPPIELKRIRAGQWFFDGGV